MDTTFSHLLGDIRQPVLVLGPDPDADGNVLVAPFQAARSVPKQDVYEAAVSSPTDTVDAAEERPGYDTSPAGTPAVGETPVSSPGAAQPTAPSGDVHTFDATGGTAERPETGQSDTVYSDNGDGTWTRTADGARGRFGPDGFTADSRGEDAGQAPVAWGG